MDFDKYQCFDFNYEKIMNFCNSFKGIDQQITYLKWILIELEHLGDDAAPILKYGYKQYLSDIDNMQYQQ